MGSVVLRWAGLACLIALLGGLLFASRASPSRAGATNASPQALFEMQVRGQPGTVTREDGTLTYDLGGSATATIDFTALRSVDPDGTITGHEWRINGALVSTARDFSFALV